MFPITLLLVFVLDPISARDDTINDSLAIEYNDDKNISKIKTISYEFYGVLGAEWFAKKINKPRQLCRGLLSCGPVHDLVCELPRPLNWMKEAAALYRIYGDVLRAIFQKFIVYT